MFKSVLNDQFEGYGKLLDLKQLWKTTVALLNPSSDFQST